MLNYNKIHSAINYDRTSKRKIAEYMGIAESTFRNRLGRENLTPNDIEKIAEFFGKTIAYYFDKDENEAPKATADCKKCIEKDKELEEKDAEILRLRLKLCETQEKYTALLEELQGKNQNRQYG